jgi:hypothetical protein
VLGAGKGGGIDLVSVSESLRGELGKLLGEAVEFAGESQGGSSGDGELLKLGAVEFVEVFEWDGRLASALGVDRAPFAMKDLFHPEAGSGAVKEAEEKQVVVFGSVDRELDDGSGLLENFFSPIEYELIVGANKGKGDDQFALCNFVR